jgi:hypothetical protein
MNVRWLVTEQPGDTPAGQTDRATPEAVPVDRSATSGAQGALPTTGADEDALRGPQADESIAYSGEEYLADAHLSSLPELADQPTISGLAWPSDANGWAVRLVVYVDEHGRVHRVEADEASIPPALLQALQVALEASSFTPGRLRGTPVKAFVHMQATITQERVRLHAVKRSG